MQDNKSISRDGTDKQNLPYSLGRFWPLWELKAISGWPLLAASVVKGLIAVGNVYKGFSFIVCLMFVTLILIMMFQSHTQSQTP